MYALQGFFQRSSCACSIYSAVSLDTSEIRGSLFLHVLFTEERTSETSAELAKYTHEKPSLDQGYPGNICEKLSK